MGSQARGEYDSESVVQFAPAATCAEQWVQRSTPRLRTVSCARTTAAAGCLELRNGRRASGLRANYVLDREPQARGKTRLGPQDNVGGRGLLAASERSEHAPWRLHRDRELVIVRTQNPHPQNG